LDRLGLAAALLTMSPLSLGWHCHTIRYRICGAGRRAQFGTSILGHFRANSSSNACLQASKAARQAACVQPFEEWCADAESPRVPQPPPPMWLWDTSMSAGNPVQPLQKQSPPMLSSQPCTPCKPSPLADIPSMPSLTLPSLALPLPMVQKQLPHLLCHRCWRCPWVTPQAEAWEGREVRAMTPS